MVSAPGRGWPRAYCRGVLVLGCAAGAWVSVGLLLGLVGSILCVSGVRVVGVDQAIKAL